MSENLPTISEFLLKTLDKSRSGFLSSNESLIFFYLSTEKGFKIILDLVLSALKQKILEQPIGENIPSLSECSFVVLDTSSFHDLKQENNQFQEMNISEIEKLKQDYVLLQEKQKIEIERLKSEFLKIEKDHLNEITRLSQQGNQLEPNQKIEIKGLEEIYLNLLTKNINEILKLSKEKIKLSNELGKLEKEREELKSKLSESERMKNSLETNLHHLPDYSRQVSQLSLERSLLLKQLQSLFLSSKPSFNASFIFEKTQNDFSLSSSPFSKFDFQKHHFEILYDSHVFQLKALSVTKFLNCLIHLFLVTSKEKRPLVHYFTTFSQKDSLFSFHLPAESHLGLDKYTISILLFIE